MVAVTSARKATPQMRPVSASTPDGMSTAILIPAAAFIAAIAGRRGDAGDVRSRSPVPKSASTIASARRRAARAQRRRRRAQAVARDDRDQAQGVQRAQHRRGVAARALDLLARRRQQHAHVGARERQVPRRHEAVAAVVAGAAHHAHAPARDRAPPSSRATTSATPRPAFSISSSVGTPKSAVAARSTARICSAVRT